MSDLHVVMPFSRPQHADLYARHLAKEGVQWHPLVESAAQWPVRNADSAGIRSTGVKDWIVPLVTGPVPEGENACYWKLNKFIDLHGTYPGDYFCFLTDDNWWHWNYFAGLKRAMARGKPVVVTSQLRPGNLLKASPSNLRILLFDISMLTVRGDVLRDMRFEERLWFADGLMGEQLAQKYQNQIDAAEECVLYYNALTPAAWGYHSNTVTA